jgi:flavin-dependent dehydrogenase
MANKKVIIFGAGISGLVAAINLARGGFPVEVAEKRERIGGSSVWHPSIHQQTFNVAKTSEYIDIDVSSCFTPVKKHTFCFYGHTSKVDMPENSVVCEKGPRPSSIENLLYAKAREYGVQFIFGEVLDSKTIDLRRKDGYGCIVATGLEQDAYRILNIKHTNVQGFRGSGMAKESETVFSYFGDYTNHDFAYLASLRDLMFCLLFSRKGIDEHNLQVFRQHLLESTGIVFDDWRFSTGRVPLETNLKKNGTVLAGTISGMIDPFFLNGISGGLISGKIAAMYFINPEEAVKEFGRFTRSFYLKRALKLMSMKTPGKQFTFPIFTLINSKIKWVGVI